MSDSNRIQVVRDSMRAFEQQDREAAAALMAEDYVFTSPQDDHLDKATWLERCFPTADHFDGGSTTLQLVEVGDTVLHRYEYVVDGTRWHNVEALRVEGGLLREVEVYFGGAVGPA